MDKQTHRSSDIPTWSALLVEAVNKPGQIMAAYSAFHNYSLGNQILALVQCQMRGLQPGPINTFPKWKELGRSVKRGERALILCMPIVRKSRAEATDDADGEGNQDRTFTSFTYKARWFAVSQTTGDEITAPALPSWEAARALAALDIERVDFTELDGNCQGYARKRQIAINPVAQLPHKTLFHESAHVLLGHTAEADFADTDRTPKSLREVEAEAVALLCCEALDLPGAEFCRGYIQSWLSRGRGFDTTAIPDHSAQKIFRVADQILRAGRVQAETANQ